jgi:hypothetical protein
MQSDEHFQNIGFAFTYNDIHLHLKFFRSLQDYSINRNQGNT